MKLFWMAVIICALFGTPQTAVSGECIESLEVCLETLGQGPDVPDFDYRLYCLSTFTHFSGGHWAGPRAGAVIQEYRDHPLRSEVLRTAIDLLNSSWGQDPAHPENAERLAELAARFAIGKLDTLDVFAAIGQDMDYHDYELLAILGDPRTVPLLAKRYRDVRGHWEYERTREELERLLCCLYHIPVPEAVKLAKVLESEETDSGLLARIRKVTTRGGPSNKPPQPPPAPGE